MKTRVIALSLALLAITGQHAIAQANVIHQATLLDG
jgi:hypothetical protein